MINIDHTRLHWWLQQIVSAKHNQLILKVLGTQSHRTSNVRAFKIKTALKTCSCSFSHTCPSTYVLSAQLTIDVSHISAISLSVETLSGTVWVRIPTTGPSSDRFRFEAEEVYLVVGVSASTFAFCCSFSLNSHYGCELSGVLILSAIGLVGRSSLRTPSTTQKIPNDN